MRARSGAGASVSSGANFQARVGAYLVASVLCKTQDAILSNARLQQLSFETMVSIDDINVVQENGVTIYIQAKATITYSINSGGELLSVIEQFVDQEHNKSDRFLLVTSSRASKKIVYDLRAALEGFRTSPASVFFRDQPQALREVITQFTSAIRTIFSRKAKTCSEDVAHELIRRMWVVALDIEASDPLEQAVILNLNAKGCIAAEAVWGKIVADCVGYSKSRKTLTSKDLNEHYGKYLSSPEETKAEIIQSFFQIEYRGDGFRAGRDVFLCDLPTARYPLPKGLAVVETYRFDDQCNERIQFTDHSVIFGDGFEAPLLLRAATYDGLTRLFEGRRELVGEREVHFCPINSEKNFDDSSCAKIHTQSLENALKRNPSPLNCVICGKAVSTNNSQIVELAPLTDPTVGTCHEACLSPSCRVLGHLQNEFFSSHDELVNFDVEAWYRAIDGGQMAFRNAEKFASGMNAVIAWDGSSTRGPEGDHVVEVSLIGGGREIVTKRNGVQRFSLDAAKSFCQQLDETFDKARSTEDPFCYTDQSKGFGPRSQLLEIFGVSENIIPVEKARHRKFDVRFAARYSRPGQWYAPLCYLRRLDTGDVFSVERTTFMVSDPLKLKTYLQNWEEVGLVAENYEVSVLPTDKAFDDFMKWCSENGETVVVDPLFDPSTGDPVSGYPVHPMDEILQ